MRIQRVALHLDRVASDIKKASKDIRAIELILEKEKLVDDHPDVIPNLKEGLTKLDEALQFIANASNLLVPKKALPMPVVSKIDVGEFNVGDRLRVTDPGYEKKSSLAACFPALPGKWLAGIYVDPEKQRVMRLFAHHADHPAAVLSSAPSATISVDAGQVGFFDDQ